jgi:hypothetical protein
MYAPAGTTLWPTCEEPATPRIGRSVWSWAFQAYPSCGHGGEWRGRAAGGQLDPAAASAEQHQRGYAESQRRLGWQGGL